MYTVWHVDKYKITFNLLAPDLFFLNFSTPVYKMQRLEVSGAVRPLYGWLGFKGLN